MKVFDPHEQSLVGTVGAVETMSEKRGKVEQLPGPNCPSAAAQPNPRQLVAGGERRKGWGRKEGDESREIGTMEQAAREGWFIVQKAAIQRLTRSGPAIPYGATPQHTVYLGTYIIHLV